MPTRDDKPLSRTRDHVRETAYALLADVLDRSQPLDKALERLPDTLATRDRSAAHRLAATTLRRLGTIDAVLEPMMRRAPPPAIRQILRLGTAQLLFLGTPAHAAVTTAVALARAKKLAAFAGLINAVLRRLATAENPLEDLDTPRLETPDWLWRSWGEHARAIACAHQVLAPLDLTLRPGAKPPAGAKILPTGTARLPPGTLFDSVPGSAGCDFWVQDAASALPARLLAARRGEEIADLCAAPGGKTAQLAMAGARVVAVDSSAPRLERLRENLARLALTAEIIEADVAEWRPNRRFSAVLLDAPCSATGTIRRHPDIPYLKRPADIPAFANVQDRLLRAAVQLLDVGGRLIYSVCSLQPEEGMQRIAAAVASLPVALAPFTPEELPELREAVTPQGFLFTHPGIWSEAGGMDGFFAARLTRRLQ